MNEQTGELHRLIGNLEQHVAPESLSVLRAKFKLMRRTRNPRQYEELLTEMQVATLLAHRASPITFEPFATRGPQSARTKSPDFGLTLSDVAMTIAIEVTVLRVNALEEFTAGLQPIVKQLALALFNKNLTRHISLQVPLTLHAPAEADISESAAVIADTESGTLPFMFGGKEAYLRWAKVPDLTPPFTEPDSVPSDSQAVVLTPNNTVTVAWRIFPHDVPTLRRLVLRSLRNTLDRKRDQNPGNIPYILVLKAGHPRLFADRLFELFYHRVWPNRNYTWLTGIAVFAGGLVFSANPNARFPASNELLSLFDSTAQYICPGCTGVSGRCFVALNTTK